MPYVFVIGIKNPEKYGIETSETFVVKCNTKLYHLSEGYIAGSGKIGFGLYSGVKDPTRRIRLIDSHGIFIGDPVTTIDLIRAWLKFAVIGLPRIMYTIEGPVDDSWRGKCDDAINI